MASATPECGFEYHAACLTGNGRWWVSRSASGIPDCLNILRLDTSGAHTAQRRRWPDSVRSVRWPPDGPELNLIERVWCALKDDGAWDQCTD
jgi:hypothetical protein